MGDGVTLIHEPWIKPFYRCNIWHVRGRDRDLLFDSGLGHVSLRRHVRSSPSASSSASRATRISTTSAAITNFPTAACIAAEAAHPRRPAQRLTLADRYATDEMFDRLPEGWDASATGSRRRPPAASSSMATSSISATAPSR